MCNFIGLRAAKASNICIVILLLSLVTSPTFGQHQRRDEIQQLVPNHKLRLGLKGGETHSYKFALKTGQFFHVDVEQYGIDVLLLLRNTEGKVLVERDRPNGTSGQESLSFISLTGGEYQLNVNAQDQHAKPGEYEIKSEVPRLPTATDKKRIDAEDLLQEGQRLGNTGKAELVTQACEKYEAAAALWRDVGDIYAEALTQTSLGTARENLRDRDRAITSHARALSLYRELHDKKNEADQLLDLGTISNGQGEKEKALEYFNQALPLFQELGDKNGEARILNNIGYMYNVLGEKQKAIDYYNRALPLRKESGDKSGQATTLNNIGIIYDDLGEKQKAVDYYSQAVSLFNEAGDKSSAASALNNIGYVYNKTGEKEKALGYFNRALPLFKEVGDKDGLALTLTNTGALYASLGEKQKALTYYDQALSLFREVGNKNYEAVVLTNIGGVYNDLGDKQQALNYYNQALPLIKKFGRRRVEAAILTNIGAAYNDLGEKQKALDYYQQALQISRDLEDYPGEAVTLHNLGRLYHSLGEEQKALDNYMQALPLYHAAGDRTGEAVIINNLMIVYYALGNTRLAIAYGKQSVNKYQQLRLDISGLNKDIQRTYLNKIEYTYRSLADLLILQRRSAEAQQVLNAFKDQQNFDLSPATKKPVPLSLTPREADFSMNYVTASEKISNTSRNLIELKLKIGNHQPSETDSARLHELDSRLRADKDDLIAFLKQAETEFGHPENTVKDTVSDIDATREMQKALRRLGRKTCVIYTLVGETHFNALIVTPDDTITVSTSTKGETINNKARQLWALLQSDEYDPTPLAKELYDLVFKPIKNQLLAEHKMDKVLPDGATIVWSLDSNLRYLPIAALYDGNKYLLEHYNNVVFTRAEPERWSRNVSSRWTGVGFGDSRGRSIQYLNSIYTFDDLPNVTEELNAIFQTKGSSSGIFEGDIFKDANFTRESMITALKQHRPLVHISSHFRLTPGDESRSFLLLGDGSVFPLNEMKSLTDLFQGVELLTLSACETAAQGANSDGREVDGFAELAQRLGAESVIATLWNVRDDSSYWLMRDFYRRKREELKRTKSDCLRQAQLALLKGVAKVDPFKEGGATGSEKGNRASIAIKILAEGKEPPVKPESGVVYIEATYAKPYKHKASRPYAHPYFWAPFILFGNWH